MQPNEMEPYFLFDLLFYLVILRKYQISYLHYDVFVPMELQSEKLIDGLELFSVTFTQMTSIEVGYYL
jgi:hypothetical protein